MRTYDTTNEKKIPMTKNTRPRSTAMNLIQEALSRARTRPPQTANSEARRSRRIALEARRRQAVEQGDVSQLRIH